MINSVGKKSISRAGQVDLRFWNRVDGTNVVLNSVVKVGLIEKI